MCYQVIFSFPELVSFLAIFQVLQCAFLIFHIFQCFSPYSISYHVCVSFSTFFSFLPIIQTYSAHCSFFTLFSVSRHIPVYTMFVTHFPWFLFFCLFFHHIPGPTCVLLIFHFFQCFSSIFRVLKCLYLSFQVFQFSCQIPILKCLFLIFLILHCFSPNSRSYSVFFSLWTLFNVSRHIPDSTVCISSFFMSFIVSCHIL
jgi:hypothetical protein